VTQLVVARLAARERLQCTQIRWVRSPARYRPARAAADPGTPVRVRKD
jgi:hypothetical protein